MPSVPFERLSVEEQVRRLRRTARAAAARWGLRGVRLRRLSHAENTTFRADVERGGGRGRRHHEPRRFLLRVHRSLKQPDDEVRSECAWLEALAAESPVPVPEPVRGPDGDCLVHVTADEAAAVDGEARTCTLLRWLPGRILGRGAGRARLRELGARTAWLHRFALDWRRLPWFVRRPWDVSGLFEEFGNRLPMPEIRRRLTPARRSLVERAEAWLQELLDEMGPAGVGLIHADLHVRNTLIHRDTGELAVLDFDDCGEGPWLYDLAVPIEDYAWIGRDREAREHLLAGYRSVGGPAEPWLDDGAPLDCLIAARATSNMLWIVDRADENTRFRANLGRWLVPMTRHARAVLRTHGRV